jgi:hypothetical protein
MPLVRPTARPLAPALALAAALATAACGDDDGGPGEQLTGRYRLVTVESGSLPYPTSFGIGNTYYIVEGSLVFSGNQVTDARRYELRTGTGTVTQTDADTLRYTYELRGDEVLLRRTVGGIAQVDTASRAEDLIGVEQRFNSLGGAPVPGFATYVRVP